MTPVAVAVWALGRLYHLIWIVVAAFLQLVVHVVDLRQDCAEEEPEEQLLALKSYRRLSKSRLHDPTGVEASQTAPPRPSVKKIDARLQVRSLLQLVDMRVTHCHIVHLGQPSRVHTETHDSPHQPQPKTTQDFL